VPQQGPVLALGSLQGQLLAAIGSKLMMWAYRDGMLNATGFYDADYAISSVATLANFVLVGDLHSGLHMVTWKTKDTTKTFELVSKNAASRSAFACEFMVDKSKGAVLIVLSEERGRLRVFTDSHKSTDGDRVTSNQLQPRGAFQVGAQPNRLLRLTLSAQPTQHALLWASLQGSLGFLAPIDEKLFRRLWFLSTKMVVGAPHVGGLNPRAHRAHDAGATTAQELKCMLDGVLLGEFASLDRSEQDTLAQQIGTTPQKVLSSINELSAAADLF